MSNIYQFQLEISIFNFKWTREWENYDCYFYRMYAMESNLNKTSKCEFNYFLNDHPWPLFRYFLVFSNKQPNFYGKSMWKNVRCRDSNPRHRYGLELNWVSSRMRRANGWIRTQVIWCRKWPLCRNHLLLVIVTPLSTFPWLNADALIDVNKAEDI